MRILCISNYYPPHFEGGYEISVSQTMQFLADHNHNVFILCGSKGNKETSIESSSFDKDGIYRVLKYINYHKASFIDKHQVEKFNFVTTIRAIKEVQPDLVYIANMKGLSIAPVLAVKKLGVPHIFDIGDIWLKAYFKHDIKSRLFRRLKSILPFTIGGSFSLSPAIVPSMWLKECIQKMYESNEVFVVPRGIHYQNTEHEVSDQYRYLFVGRIEPLKGLHLIINAVHMIVENAPSFCFSIDIYGDEDVAYADECRKSIINFGLEDRFHFKGKQSNIMDIYKAYDVLIMPTLAEEAFGRVVIEAMASGVLVLATNAYGPAEIISHRQDGWLFNTADSNDLSLKILEISNLDTNMFSVMREKAKQKIQHQYEISIVQGKILSILEYIVQRSLNIRSEGL